MKAEQEMSRLKKEEMSQMMLLEIARARYNIEDCHTRVILTRKSLSQARKSGGEQESVRGGYGDDYRTT